MKAVLVTGMPKCCNDCKCNFDHWCSFDNFERHIDDLEQKPSWCPLRPFTLGEELRKFRGTIKDKNTLIGFNMAIAICNKYLGEQNERN